MEAFTNSSKRSFSLFTGSPPSLLCFSIRALNSLAKRR